MLRLASSLAWDVAALCCQCFGSHDTCSISCSHPLQQVEEQTGCDILDIQPFTEELVEHPVYHTLFINCQARDRKLKWKHQQQPLLPNQCPHSLMQSPLFNRNWEQKKRWKMMGQVLVVANQSYLRLCEDINGLLRGLSSVLPFANLRFSCNA